MQILMVNVITSLLNMDNSDLNLAQFGSPDSVYEPHIRRPVEDTVSIECDEGNKSVIFFTRLLLDILSHSLPSSIEKHDVNDGLDSGAIQALEWRTSVAKCFIEDWEWRLSILQRLLPLSDRQWSWKEALTVLRAAPSKLLNL